MQTLWQWIVRRNVGKGNQDPDGLKREQVKKTIDYFDDLFDEDNSQGQDSSKKLQQRKAGYTTMVNAYYDLVTDFYEYGWGQSFHFAPRFEGEDFLASLARHEYFLASKIGAKPGMKVLDIGCGVGGPMRNIVRYCGVSVVGINNNAYQLKRCQLLNEKMGVDHLCSMIKCDFMNLKVEPNSFDGCYIMEASCHAPDRVGCYSQVFNALKEGAYFSNFEWVMTDKYDEKNPEHNKIKHDIEWGDSLPELTRVQTVLDAVEKAGFELIEHFDMAVVAPRRGNDVPWYSTLQGGLKLSQIKHSKIGRAITQKFVDTLEFLHVAPSGVSKTHKMLSAAADGLVGGGQTGIFTPMYFFLARKPVTSKKGKNEGNDRS